MAGKVSGRSNDDTVLRKPTIFGEFRTTTRPISSNKYLVFALGKIDKS